MNSLPQMQRVIDTIKQASHILVITGAGISADSGLPTYRGISGLYNHAHTEEGLPIEVALSGEVMQRSPAITWKYLSQIEHACRSTQPNPAHHAITTLQRYKPLTLLTQNIDAFHTAAGTQNIIEMHGNLFSLRCMHCTYHEQVCSYQHFNTLPPHCPKCGHFLRPNVVLFGEMLPKLALTELEHVLQTGYDLVISIGTSSVFPYIAYPFQQAGQIGALALEINPTETEVSKYADIRWPYGAAHALNELIKHLPD